jgi:hypothetical protein
MLAGAGLIVAAGANALEDAFDIEPASIVYLAAILSSWLLQVGAGIWCLTLHGLRLIGACLVAPLPMVVALDLPGQAPTIVISALVIWALAARTRSSP